MFVRGKGLSEYVITNCFKITRKGVHNIKFVAIYENKFTWH